MCGPTPAYCTRLVWQVPNLLRAQQHNIAIMLEWENLSTLQFYTHTHIYIYIYIFTFKGQSQDPKGSFFFMIYETFRKFEGI
jgi:hypothetical protein